MRCFYYNKLIFPLSTIKIRLFNLLEFEIEKNDGQHFKKKNNNTRDLESDQLIFKFGVLQRVRHKPNAPHRIMEFSSLTKMLRCRVSVKFKC